MTVIADAAVDALTDTVSFYRRLNPWLVDPEPARPAEIEAQRMIRDGEAPATTDKDALLRAGIRLLHFAEPIEWPCWRHVQAFWRLLQQRILTRRAEALGRPTRRRAVREIRTANVVTLRPLHHGHRDDANQAVDCTHSWLVSGHWRTQSMPSTERPRAALHCALCQGPGRQAVRGQESEG